MRRFLSIVIVLFLIATPVCAQEFTAPEAPESAQRYMPENIHSFGEDLWFVIKSAFSDLQPSLADAAGICLSAIAVVLLVTLTQSLSEGTKKITEVTGTVVIGVLLISPAKTLIGLGADTVVSIGEYGKLFIPVMTAAFAAQGGINASGALYTVTTVFCSFLTSLICKLLVPLVYVMLCLSLASGALEQEMLGKLKDAVKWLVTWSLKTVLYVFTGFLTITGVVSGTTDASLLKAAKMTVSGCVPVVGGILSDASEAVLVGAGTMKNAAGVYGIIAILAIWIGPFLQIGIQYLLVKFTAAVCQIWGTKQTVNLIQDFSGAMGLVLAMTGSVCTMLVISTICFMKGTV